MNSTLMRSRYDRKIAGVCGGIAQSQGWDSNIVRVIWIATVLFAGTGILAYIVLWVVLPEEPLALPTYVGYPPAQGYPGTYPPPQGYPPPSQGYPPPPQGYPPPPQGYPPPPSYGSNPPQPGSYPGGQTFQGPDAPSKKPE